MQETQGKIKNVTIISLSNYLGDGILLFPAVRTLRQLFPDAFITWIATQGTCIYKTRLADLVCGYIDRVEDAFLPNGFFRSFFSFAKARKKITCTQDIVFDSTRKPLQALAHRRCIPCIEYLCATRGSIFSTKHFSSFLYKPKTHFLDRFQEIFSLYFDRYIEIDKSPIYFDDKYRKIAQHILPETPPNKKYVGFSPGAGSLNKCWPLDRFMRLANEVQKKNDIIPVFFLGPTEEKWLGRIRDAVPAAIFPEQSVQVITIYQSMAFFERMWCVIANDSGAGHLAGAVHAHLISLFGPLSHDRWSSFTPHLHVISALENGGAAMSYISYTCVAEKLQQVLLSRKMQ